MQHSLRIFNLKRENTHKHAREKNQEQSVVKKHEILDPWWISAEVKQQREDEEVEWCFNADKKKNTAQNTDKKSLCLYNGECISKWRALREDFMEDIVYLASWRRW